MKSQKFTGQTCTFISSVSFKLKEINLEKFTNISIFQIDILTYKQKKNPQNFIFVPSDYVFLKLCFHWRFFNPNLLLISLTATAGVKVLALYSPLLLVQAGKQTFVYRAGRMREDFPESIKMLGTSSNYYMQSIWIYQRKKLFLSHHRKCRYLKFAQLYSSLVKWAKQRLWKSP